MQLTYHRLLEHSSGHLHAGLIWVSMIFCATYAFAELIYPDIGRLAEGGLLAATAFALIFGMRAKHLRIPLALLALSLVAESASWVASLNSPAFGFEPDAAPRIDLLSKWFLFLVMAFWLYRFPFGVRFFWLAAIAGTSLLPWVNGDALQEFQLALNNQRIDAGTMNAQHAAMISGILLIGGLALFIQLAQSRQRKYTFALAAIYLVTSGLFFLFATQTRGVWLGTAIASVVIIALYFFLTKKSRSRSLSKLSLLAILTVLLCGVTLALNSNLANRIHNEGSSLELVLEGKIDQLPLDSTGVRVRSWYYAIPWIAQKPWFGWGPDGSKLIMQESAALPESLKSKFGHLHNTYLDILAQYGFFGLLLYFALLIWLLMHIATSYYQGAMPLSAFLFGAGTLIYWLFINFFESYIFFSSGKYALTIVLKTARERSFNSEIIL